MESIQYKRRKNKKKLMILSGISALTVIGGTLAYFTTSDDIKNTFRTAKYQATITENFTSPKSWIPGDTVSKDVSVRNTGNMDMALRATYTESWVSANNEELSLKNDGKDVAVINFNDSWERADDGYYYYGNKTNLKKLSKDEVSTSFIESVTFNKDITLNLEKDVSDDGQTITYRSSGNGYDNAVYTLTIKIDTIQYNQAKEVW